jgi:hypothetical protein
MGWGFQLIIAVAVLCATLLIAALIAAAFAICTFFVAKRLLRGRTSNPKRSAILIAAVFGVVALLVAFQLQWVISLWPITHPGPPTPHDVVGTWVPTEWPITWMTERHYRVADQRIDFFTDGTFTAIGIPTPYLAGIIHSEEKSYSGGGTWEMVDKGKTWEMALTFTPSSSRQTSTTYNAPWIPTMALIYFQVPGEVNQASFQKCGPVKMRMNDPAMDRYRPAIQTIDRESLGFTPIPDDAWVEIQPVGGPQVWIDIYGDTSRTIALKQADAEYEWIYEQEIAYGPDQWPDGDGSTWQEMVSIDYQTEEVNGVPVNRTIVMYTGRDPRLTSLGPLYLSIEDVKPILEEWRVWRAQQPPDPVGLCP